MLDRLIKKVALARSRVLLIVQSPQVLLLHAPRAQIPLANDSLFIVALTSSIFPPRLGEPLLLGCGGARRFSLKLHHLVHLLHLEHLEL